MSKLRVVTVKITDKPWAASEFPHPLVTLDYDEKGDLVAVEVCGTDLEVTEHRED